jgi:hypothetical protein
MTTGIGVPLMDHGGHPPGGDVWSFEAGLVAFKEAFMTWHDELRPGQWERTGITSSMLPSVGEKEPRRPRG